MKEEAVLRRPASFVIACELSAVFGERFAPLI